MVFVSWKLTLKDETDKSIFKMNRKSKFVEDLFTNAIFDNIIIHAPHSTTLRNRCIR